MSNNNNINCKLVTITPIEAAEMLKLNTKNRTLNQNHVNRLVKEITEGRWKVNGDTICRNDTEIIDGQHRLTAVVIAGIPIQTFMVYGLSKDVFNTKDVGKKRSPGDTLSVLGKKHASRLASMLFLIDRYYNGKVKNWVHYSNTELEELLVKYPEAEKLNFKISYKGLVNPSAMDACRYLFHKSDPVLAEQFVDQVVRGINLNVDNPCYVLREKLLAHNHLKSKPQMERVYLMAICIKAWNALRQGRKIKMLRWSGTGAKAEDFPRVL